MDSKERQKTEWKRFVHSFRHAADGIRLTFKKERNFQIHCLLSVLTIAAGFYFDLTKMEWMVVLLLIGGMLSLELMNTAIERTVDLVTSEYKPLAKAAKDTAAGAVFLFAILAFILGIMIFIPKII
ncbi:diacylglycerol kinase family protein [Metabacillus sp. RGM 3146]|uniref:diacylglycerol kinase family protein n=1 Tax=Metabacillus sp. RGM 3146 TaxID=3401092 RepID=UPI003B9C8071